MDKKEKKKFSRIKKENEMRRNDEKFKFPDPENILRFTLARKDNDDLSREDVRKK